MGNQQTFPKIDKKGDPNLTSFISSPVLAVHFTVKRKNNTKERNIKITDENTKYKMAHTELSNELIANKSSIKYKKVIKIEKERRILEINSIFPSLIPLEHIHLP